MQHCVAEQLRSEHHVKILGTQEPTAENRMDSEVSKAGGNKD